MCIVTSVYPRIVQFSSVTQSCPTLCDLMNCSTPGLPVHHELPEFTQTHVHRVSDAIQPSHPQSSFKLQLGLCTIFSQLSICAGVSLTPSGKGYSEQGPGLCFS